MQTNINPLNQSQILENFVLPKSVLLGNASLDEKKAEPAADRPTPTNITSEKIEKLDPIVEENHPSGNVDEAIKSSEEKTEQIPTSELIIDQPEEVTIPSSKLHEEKAVDVSEIENTHLETKTKSPEETEKIIEKQEEPVTSIPLDSKIALQEEPTIGKKTIFISPKSDDKTVQTIQYLDEHTKTEKRYSWNQKLIRKREEKLPTMTQSTDLKRVTSTKVKDEDSLAGLKFKPPHDPLDAFDEEEAGVFFSIHKERSSDKLLVTHNPLASSYQIKATRTVALTELSHMFYSELDPSFQSMVPLEYGMPKTILVNLSTTIEPYIHTFFN
mgnify:FL=1